jgi:hypothetical protein
LGVEGGKRMGSSRPAWATQKTLSKKKKNSWGCSLVVECLPSMDKALVSFPERKNK